jgi:hypothetical protein
VCGSQNSLPSRSTVTIPAPHRPAGQTFLQAPTPAIRSTPYPVVQVDIGGSFERVKRPPCSASVENE